MSEAWQDRISAAMYSCLPREQRKNWDDGGRISMTSEEYERFWLRMIAAGALVRGAE